jgi:hypothetical protein
MSNYVQSVMSDVSAKNPAEPEFHQAVKAVGLPHFSATRRTRS